MLSNMCFKPVLFLWTTLSKQSPVVVAERCMCSQDLRLGLSQVIHYKTETGGHAGHSGLAGNTPDQGA